MNISLLKLTDKLPLTCSRKGTCCHGNQVFLNPWEIAQLANDKKYSINEFIDHYCEWGGIKLKFESTINEFKKKACNLYSDTIGCTVHKSRPLACRLFPIGRQIQNQQTKYIFEGNQFPCFNGCEEVKNLPFLTVEEYLIGQNTQSFEIAQDEYLEIVQNLADISISLLLETDLIHSENHKTLREWSTIGLTSSEKLSNQIQSNWLEYLLAPNLSIDISDVIKYTQAHNSFLHSKAQEQIDKCQTLNDIFETCLLMMRISLYLATAVGANANELAIYWISIAKENGARK